MPTVILDRIPLPNLKLYTTISVALLSCCLYYAVVTTSDPDWRALSAATPATTTQAADAAATSPVDSASVTDALNNASEVLEKCAINGDPDGDEQRPQQAVDLRPAEIVEPVVQQQVKEAEQQQIVAEKQPAEGVEAEDAEEKVPRTFSGHMKDVVSFMCQEAVCIWTLINMAYCCLILLGKSIQKVVFGELRISEQQHLKDKFWNFVFYKFIFVFGVVNVQFMHEVVLWVAWFSILGFLHLLSQLCKDRFEYLSFSPTTPGWSHVRLVALLSSILTLSGFMFIICICVGFFGGLNTFAFMAAECVLLTLRTLHVLIRYGMFLYDMRHGGLTAEVVSWEKRGPLAYYVELAFDVASLTIDLAHHMHMLLWSNIFLSMASLVIVMHLRFLTHEIQRKFKKHRNYLWVLNHMEKSYPLATADDLALNSDNCAICWERMETARKLPCSHLFHNSCLQSWLEQDPSCPTCRLALSVQQSVSLLHPTIDRIEEPESPRRANNHFFQFNGSRYVSWLPTFSVEVTHINSVFRVGPVVPQPTHTSQVRNMARQVQQMFPTYPISVLIADLQVSRSMEVTIDNILEGRLQIPATFSFDDDSEFGEGSGDRQGAAGTAQPSTSGVGGGDEVNGAIGFGGLLDSDYSPSTSSSSSLDSGYEIERNSNIFGNQSELLRDESLEDIPLGDRFSKSSNEREKILHRRKEMLMAVARKRYLEKSKSELNVPASEVVRHRNKTSIEAGAEVDI